MHNWKLVVSNPWTTGFADAGERERRRGRWGKEKEGGGWWSKKKKKKEEKKMKIAWRGTDDFQNFDLSLWATKKKTEAQRGRGWGRLHKDPGRTSSPGEADLRALGV